MRVVCYRSGDKTEALEMERRKRIEDCLFDSQSSCPAGSQIESESKYCQVIQKETMRKAGPWRI